MSGRDYTGGRLWLFSSMSSLKTWYQIINIHSQPMSTCCISSFSGEETRPVRFLGYWRFDFTSSGLLKGIYVWWVMAGNFNTQLIMRQNKWGSSSTFPHSVTGYIHCVSGWIVALPRPRGITRITPSNEWMLMLEGRSVRLLPSDCTMWLRWLSKKQKKNNLCFIQSDVFVFKTCLVANRRDCWMGTNTPSTAKL